MPPLSLSARWVVGLGLAWGGQAVAVAPGAQAFEGCAGGEYVSVGVAAPDELHADGQVALGHARRDGRGGVSGEVHRVRQAPADQRVDLGAVDLGWALGVSVGGVFDR